MSLLSALSSRAGDACELCGALDALAAHPISGAPTDDEAGAVLLCATCRAGLADETAIPSDHWHCLRESAWSGVPAVQVVAWRQLRALQAPWATDLADQIWLDDEVRAWAEAAGAEAPTTVVDCNGAVLQTGDSVTLIKDLVVKGANFTAKRGTMVKNIRLGDDPTHVEGRVNKQSIYLKTTFLKRASS